MKKDINIHVTFPIQRKSKEKQMEEYALTHIKMKKRNGFISDHSVFDG